MTTSSKIIKEELTQILIKENNVSTIISSCKQGPVGPAGESFPTENIIVQDYKAEISLSALRVVYAFDDFVNYANNTDNLQSSSILGITLIAASINTYPKILTYGIFEDSSWTWDSNKELYLGLNGFIIQNEPIIGNIVPLGFAISPTKIFIDIEKSILIE